MAGKYRRLIDAVEAGDAEAVRGFIERGAKVNAEYKNEGTALLIAMESEDTECVRMLLDAGATAIASIHDQRCGNTPLHWAARNGSAKIVRTVLESRIDMRGHDWDGLTALHWAAVKGHAECVRMLLDAGFDVEAKSVADKDYRNNFKTPDLTPLVFAIRGGHGDCVRILIEAGADVNAKNEFGRTALHWATDKMHAECVRLLLEAGADVNAKDKDGVTALQASMSGNEDVVRLLLDAGADVHAADKMGYTALDHAEKFERPAFIALLHEHEMHGDVKKAGGEKRRKTKAEKAGPSL